MEQPSIMNDLNLWETPCLGSVVASYLYGEAPEGDEGYLTKMRSKIVSREHFNELGKELNLDRFCRN